MKFPYMSDGFKGLLLIISGCIILIDTLGIAGQFLHKVVLIGSILMIIAGAFMADVHKRIYRLLTKKKEEPPQTPQW